MSFFRDLRRKVARRDPGIDSDGSPSAPSGTDTSTAPPKLQALFPRNHTHGLRILHTPPNADVDVVFLHGLKGRPDKTFFHKESNIYWPVDLLPKDVPNGRILAFGYDANVAKLLGPVGQNTLEDHASDLINDLARLRGNDISVSRKTIFVVHSLGGLVTKRALALSESSADEHLRTIERDTIGIAFLGTPHRGSDIAHFAKAVANIVEATGSRANSNILEVLKRDSQVLAGVENSFTNWVRKNNSRFQLACFCEELATPKVGIVVKRDSAQIAGWPQLSIHADHTGMAKFSSLEDEGYQRVSGELKRWIQHLEVIPVKSCQEKVKQTLEDWSQRLGFNESKLHGPFRIYAHINKLRALPGFEQKLEWFTESPEFQAWHKEPGLNLLWLHGSPKTDKTVVTAYVSMHLSQYFEYAKNWDMAAFFIHPDSSEFELLVSIVLQLIQNSLRADAAWMALSSMPSQLTAKRDLTNQLWKLLELVITEVPTRETVLFIDGIDVLRPDVRSTLLANLSTLEKRVACLPLTTRIMISSRPYLDLSAMLEHYIPISKGKEWQDCLASLFFKEWDARRSRIEKLEGGSWLSSHKDYVQWIESPDSSLLWIEGKPGSGKSTLSKRIARTQREVSAQSTASETSETPDTVSIASSISVEESSRKSRSVGSLADRPKDTILADFYYSFRGGVTETSHELMLRSILYQLWQANEGLFSVFRNRYRQLEKRKREKGDKERLWGYEDLKAAIRSLHEVDFPLRVIIVVDGMDESDNVWRNDVLDFLPSLSSQTTNCIIKVLVASRPETDINTHLRQGYHIVLQQENAQDIREAVGIGIDELERLSGGSKTTRASDSFSAIKRYMEENSEGVFLWVSLVLKDLERFVRKGAYTMAGLEKRVRRLPKELGGTDGFYRAMVESLTRRIEGDHDQDDEDREEELGQGRRILNWITFANRSLLTEELVEILATPLQSEVSDLSSYDLDENRPRELERGVLSYCGGLVEVRGAFVQLLHQTAREFLLDRRQTARPYDLNEIQGDKEIAATCYHYFRIIFTAKTFQTIADEDFSQMAVVTHALNDGVLLEYVLNSLLDHLDHLAGESHDIRNEFEAFVGGLGSNPTSYASLTLSLWLEQLSLPSTVQKVPDKVRGTDFLQAALVKAAGAGELRAVTTLCRLYANVNVPDRNNVYPLENAARHGQSETVIVLSRGFKANPDSRGHYGTPLETASFFGHETVVEYLTGMGVDVNAAGPPHGNALQAASFQGHKSIVTRLIDYGADPNAPAGPHGAAIQAASLQGHKDIVIYLLKQGADPNAPAGPHGTAMEAAFRQNHHDVLQDLLHWG